MLGCQLHFTDENFALLHPGILGLMMEAALVKDNRRSLFEARKGVMRGPHAMLEEDLASSSKCQGQK